MTILNFGSCCIDNVYSVPHFAGPGETFPCSNFEVHPGGKGLNHSIALAASGAQVHHAGKVGKDGLWLVELLKSKNVKTESVYVDEGPSGHANIQVTPEGENSIVLFGGANKKNTTEAYDKPIEVQVFDFLISDSDFPLFFNFLYLSDLLIPKFIRPSICSLLNSIGYGVFLPL